MISFKPLFKPHIFLSKYFFFLIVAILNLKELSQISNFELLLVVSNKCFSVVFVMLKYSECITFKVQSSHVPNDSVSVLDFEMCVEILAIVYSTHRHP